MKTIGINYTSAINQNAGIGRYTRELVKTLSRLDTQTPYRLFMADTKTEETIPLPGPNFSRHCTSLSERWLARLWYRLRLPLWIQAWTGAVDLFHQPDFVLPPVWPGTRTLLTVHDLSFENQPSDSIMPGMETHLKKWVPASVRRASHVIAVSEATRQDLIERYHTPPEKITTLYHGVTPNFQPVTNPETLAAVKKKYGLDERPFILSISTLQPRKNYRRLVEAFAQVAPSYTLVLGGGRGWGYEEIFAAIDALGLQDRVYFPGYIADADLPALYSAARLFAYPSLYEGFGMPLLEAMACGTPVLTSNLSSLPEVVEEAGILVDPYDVEAIAAGLSTLLHDENLRQHYVQAGIEQAQKFTWDGMVTKLLALYQTLLEE